MINRGFEKVLRYSWSVQSNPLGKLYRGHWLYCKSHHCLSYTILILYILCVFRIYPDFRSLSMKVRSHFLRIISDNPKGIFRYNFIFKFSLIAHMQLLLILCLDAASDPQNDTKSDQNVIQFAKIKRAKNIEKSTLSTL